MDIDVRNSTAVGDPVRGSRTAICRRPPSAGEPGHGLGAVLRRQAVRNALSPTGNGHTALFELICYDCGDDLGLDYSEVIPRLQRLRGPRTIAAAWLAYERHLGLGLTG
jgi:hypothetical protein